MSQKSPSQEPSEALWGHLRSGLESAWPSTRWRNLGVVVGCSGGADSVALLKLVCELQKHDSDAKGFVIAAHFNHALRGDASDADQAFVAELSTSVGARFVAGHPGGVPPADEAAMRMLRRDFLIRAAQNAGARYIATAHTADDNVETLLHHLMRGTGPTGLAGIAPATSIGPVEDAKDFVLVRPMLAIRRGQIRDALQSVGQSWCEDASNQNTDYRRNWIRHRLIPLIESEYPCAVTAMNRTVDIQHDWRRLVEGLAREWLDTHRQEVHPPRLGFDRTTESALVISALQHLWDEQGWPRREMTTEHWRRLAKTIQAGQPDRYSIPGNIDVVATDEHVTLTNHRPQLR